MELTREIADQLNEVAYEFGFDQFDIREDYSGRGMYGRSVVALVGDGDDRDLDLVIGIAIGQGELEADAAKYLLQRRDSMGRGWVRY